ncbi:hypothetical protein NKW53_13715 [Acetobacter orientalis]|uniref:hypothetical protein n=1 Tax=Acetobacter orientalis TaxID=146474 RepID=UPI00209E7E8A|nr:hypothetical protein [Acetobacter orientalis]MCP1217118.1 hypothetical protein [Acetobacter orientalis]MCP1220029.1 hypothetical protein [Acetobacter orientalis]
MPTPTCANKARRASPPNQAEQHTSAASIFPPSSLKPERFGVSSGAITAAKRASNAARPWASAKDG